MDNRGYIFSTDAVLALVIFFIIVGSILTYYTLPSYLGADHQHLEAEADAVLAALQADGTLTTVILKINSGNKTQYDEGIALLKGKLDLLLSDDVAYDLQIPNVDDGDLRDSKGIINIRDRASRYTVLSAPNEGWVGRAWYKIEDVKFKNESVNTTQTFWNFHNYINQFAWWKNDNKLVTHPYWGTNDSDNPVPIGFSVPSNITLKNVYVILGCHAPGNYYLGDGKVRSTTKFRLDKYGNPEYQNGLKDGWNTNKWYPLNGNWSDENTEWAYGEFYLLPNVLPGSSSSEGTKSRIPMKEDVAYTGIEPYNGNIYTVSLKPRDNYQELYAYKSFAFNLNINNNNYFGNFSGYPGSPFKYLFRADNTSGGQPIYNGKANIPTDWLNIGEKNNFYMEFLGIKSNVYVMPWFSILADYTTSIPVPQGIDTVRFPDKDESENYYCAGIATAPKTDPGYPKSILYDTFNLTSGVSKVVGCSTRATSFEDYHNKDSDLANGIPFVLEKRNTPGTVMQKDGCAVAREYPIDLRKGHNKKITSDNIRVVDAYTVVNTYGAGDKILVEVYDGTNWHDVFYSQNNSYIGNNKPIGSTTNPNGNGYGNTPGTVHIDEKYLTPNKLNKVRVTVWDDVNNRGGYDFVGIADTYTVVSFTSLPIKWINYPFVNVQSNVKTGSSTQSVSQEKDFKVGSNPNCEKVMFFFGVGLDTSHVKLEVKDKRNPLSDWKTLYDDDVIPFALDIGEIDSKGDQIFTTNASDGTYIGKQGDYTLKLTVSTNETWKSGDEISSSSGKGKSDAAACEIFSGSRIAVIYPKFLKNLWVTEYSDTADSAKQKATAELIKELNNTDEYVNSKIQSEALYTGDMPNSVPIRLDLWRS